MKTALAENYLTYTESDPTLKFDVSGSTIYFTNLLWSDTGYVCRNMGANHFSGDFDHYLTLRITYANLWGFVSLWALANVINDWLNILGSNNSLSLYVYRNNTSGALVFGIREQYGGSGYVSQATGASDMTYYVRIKRTGISFTADFYANEADRESEVNALISLSLTLQEVVAYQYVYAIQARTGTGSDRIDGWVQRLDLQEKSISGVTRDSSGNPLGNCVVWIFRASDKLFLQEDASDGSGNYAFSTSTDTTTQCFVRSHKDGTPNVFGVTDRNLVGS